MKIMRVELNMKDGKFKILSTIFLAIIIVLSSVVWLSLNQVQDLENKNNDLEIMNDNLQNKINQLQTLRIESLQFNGYDNPVGVVWNYKFLIKVLNNGTSDVDGLALTYNISSNYNIDREVDIYDPHQGSNVVSWELEEPYILGIIEQGETKEVYGLIWNNLDDSAKLRGSTFIVTLKLEDTVIDQTAITF
jgi:hypothetical protein